MENKIKSYTFIKIFSVEKNAERFAKENGGRLTIHYDWDDMERKIIKQFIVKY